MRELDRFGAVRRDDVRPRIGRVSAVQPVEPFDDALGLFDDHLAVFVGRADVEPEVAADADQLFFVDRPHAGDLNGVVAHFLDLLQRFEDERFGFQEFPERVKLGRDLMLLHKNPPCIDSGFRF